MAIKLNLLRPDDLLNLTVEGENLRLDPGSSKSPALVLDDKSKPGYLILTFPPQAVIEEAVFESSPANPPPDESSLPYNNTPPPASPPPYPARARISGPTRLVFRLPAGSTTRIPYDTQGLLEWDGLELAVSPLADVPAEPSEAQRQAAPAIAKPGRLETSIELPYRLHISPNHAVAWLHARSLRTHGGVTELWHTRLANQLKPGQVIELSRKQPAPLRAIWSPDFNPNKFLATDPPLFQQPDPDWGVLTAMTPSDRHEIVVNTSAFHGYVKDKTDLRSYEPLPFQVEQLMLSPLGGWLKSRGNWDPPVPFKPYIYMKPVKTGPVIVRPAWQDFIKDISLQTLPKIPRAKGLARLADLASLPELKAQQAELSRAVKKATDAAVAPAGQSKLAGLNDAILVQAGSLSGILWPLLSGETGDLLNLSEWTHIATLGRDHYVRIVYEGHLYPFGQRAALIKVTERKIRDVSGPVGTSTPLAYLVQHMFIVVRQPLRDFTQPQVKSQMENGGRGLPFRNIRLTTLVTPDIANPAGPSKIPGTLYSFWVRLGSGAGSQDDFKFHAIGEDIAGNMIDLTASLVFIPFGESAAGRNLAFNGYTNAGEARAVSVPKQKVTYAPAAAGGANENTNLTTTALYFTNQTKPVPYDKNFGMFLPRLLMASVNVPAVEAMLGQTAATKIALHDKYLSNAAGNTTGLFAQIVKETVPGVVQAEKLASAFTADKGGGFATPDLSISGLTSKLGPLAGDLANAAGDIFDPADFFNDVKDAAKLFGTLSLADLLEPLTMGAGAPKLQFNKETLPATPPAQKLKLIATLDWTPEVKDLDFEIVTFHADRNGTKSKFAVHGRFEQIVELPPTGPVAQPLAKMEGSLTDFRIELLHVVEVLFERFAFTSQAGKKMDVTVALDSDTPVRFMEDLQFVEELRKNIPAGLFGDGPYLDINLTRVKAGFSLALPPVAVGVFSLKDVVLAAFIELPFLDGRPLFDFGFSTREHPFILTVSFLGGGGFFHLQLDTKGIKLLEAALEFGASASIDLGVASGSVHIMAGIYFSMQRREIDGLEVDAATLEGYLRLGGELSILGIISVSLEFYLSFRYESAKNAAYGRATLTVKIEILFFSTSVDVTVEKRFGGSGGDPLFLDTFTTAAVWDEYAGAFA
ncbi:MAG TPA: hypothetical protein VGK00_16290 [Anaerolineales bacterium]|jgi:hypothetical protein